MRWLVRSILAACVAAASPAAGQESDWSKVVALARQEGKVVVYNSALGAPYFQAVLKSFEATYGIQIESLDVRASELSERIRTEQTAGRYLGDIEMHSTSTIEQQMRDGDTVQPHGGVPNIASLREPFAATAMRVPAFVQAYGILLNTRLVKPADEPKSWTDLLDPRWKGKILSDDMRPLGGGQTMFFVLQKAYGGEFHEKLAAQHPVFSRDLRNDARRVARGEYPIYIPQLFAFASDLGGLPVKVVLPSEGSPYVPIDFAMLKNAPHPNAARLLINHFLEAESQLRYANAWMIPVVKGVAERANEDARRFAAAKLLGATNVDERDAMMALAKKVYK